MIPSAPRPGRLLTALAFCLGVAAAFCERGATAPGPRGGEPAVRGGRVVIGVRGDVSSFNIYTATTAFTQDVVDLLYPRLAVEQDDFSQGPPTFRPALASSWETSSDGRSLTFHLDPRARWSDGRPVTAADVLFSHRAARSPEVGWVGSDVKEFVESATAPDPATVVFRFDRRYPYQLMDAAEGSVLPAHLFSAIPFAEWSKRPFDDAKVTAGPFVLKRYEPGSLIELARNPAYLHAPLPRLAAVVFRVIPDEETLLNELVTGGIDVMENVPPRALARIEAAGRSRIVRVPDLSYHFICWNVSRPLFADRRVRRALTLAIDRAAIIEALLPGVGRPSTGPILSFMWAHDDAKAEPYDPDAARALLREAGWVDRDGDGLVERDGVPFRFDLETNQGSGLRADAVQMVSAMLRKVGIAATPRTYEMGTFVARHEKHDFDAFLGSWRESTKVDLKSAFHGASRENGYNYGLYSNPELDRVIDEARATRDAATARPLWIRAQRLIAQDQPYTFLFERDRLNAVPRDLQGVRMSPRSAYVSLEEWSRSGP